MKEIAFSLCALLLHITSPKMRCNDRVTNLAMHSHFPDLSRCWFRLLQVRGAVQMEVNNFTFKSFKDKVRALLGRPKDNEKPGPPAENQEKEDSAAKALLNTDEKVIHPVAAWITAVQEDFVSPQISFRCESSEDFVQLFWRFLLKMHLHFTLLFLPIASDYPNFGLHSLFSQTFPACDHGHESFFHWFIVSLIV